MTLFDITDALFRHSNPYVEIWMLDRDGDLVEAHAGRIHDAPEDLMDHEICELSAEYTGKPFLSFTLY